MPVVQDLFSSGLASSTQQVYRCGSRRFQHFCSLHNLPPYPAGESTLTSFVAWLYQTGVTAGTITSYLSAVRYTQISLGLGDPHAASMPQLEYVVKGAKRKTAARGSRPRLPITGQILTSLIGVWENESDQFNGSMLWATACMCFFGILRVGEIVVPSDRQFDSTLHLTVDDVLVESPQWIQIRIKASKTDPFRKGVSIYVGITGTWICPVSAILDYRVRRGSQSGPFFLFSNGQYLTRQRFVARLREALQAAGVDASLYAGHSFRIGAATTAAMCGIQDSLIKTLGRWESSAYSLYVCTPRECLCRVSRQLMQQGPEHEMLKDASSS